jgi:hypothetical protein
LWSRAAKIGERIKYLDWLVIHGIEGERDLGFWVRHAIKRFYDASIHKRLRPAGLLFWKRPASDPS